MGLIQIVLILCVVGFLLYLVEKFIPLDATLKLIIRGLVIIVVVLWLLQTFGLIGSIQDGSMDNIRIK